MIRIIKFTTNWCQPCKTLTPILEQIQSENPGIIFESVDADQNKNATHGWKVVSVPTVIITKNGTEVTRFTGVKPKFEIQNLINKYK